MTQPLPIDAHLAPLAALLETHKVCVLRAEPGAGKTTRVPPALAQAPWAQGRAVWVLQPRRLAALVAARRVAEERGQDGPGGFVGYHFRFERRESADTRVLFLTEGMFLRRLQAEPDLGSVACVALDEFHERSLDADLSLALLRRLRARRDDLRLLLLSATLDARELSAALGDCPVVDCPGRAHPVEVSYLEQGRGDPNEPVERRAARGLASVVGEAGDILAFLPGVSEIRRVAGRLAGDPAFDGRRVLALHGRLSPQEQRQVLEPADGPKLILATNVAETSLTVPGVRVVVDSGLTRRDVFNPFSGLGALATLPASQSAMVQRAGRAGREAPGRCLRLCSAAEFQARARFDEPELRRADLAPALLQSLAAGYGDLEDLPWLEAPPSAHVQAARSLLRDLGALGRAGGGEGEGTEKREGGAAERGGTPRREREQAGAADAGEWGLTDKGRALARAPLHPRLAALAWEARAGSKAEWDELLACLHLLSEGRLREPDFLTALERFDPGSADRRLLEQVEGWLAAEKGRPASTQGEWRPRLILALLRAFPEQVAASRQGTDKRGEARFVLASGVEAVGRWDDFKVAPGFYLLMELLETRALGRSSGLPRVQSLLALGPEWLLEALPERVQEEVQVHFDPGSGRIQARGRLAYGALVLEESAASGPAAQAAAAELLMKEARKAGLGSFCGDGQPGRYLARRAFALALRPGAELPDETALWAELEGLVRQGASSFGELRQADPLRLALERREGARRLLDELAPSRLRLASGRETSIHYADGREPWVASRLQDFFGTAETPRLGGKPLTVELLAPNQRPQQVTRDLAGFWEREYPRLRRELMRRYPRHAWPEDPLART